MVKREIQDAERVYVNGILQNGLKSGHNLPFWKTHFCSKSNDNVITDSLSKAEILNSQFKSVFNPSIWKYISPVAGYSIPQN